MMIVFASFYSTTWGYDQSDVDEALRRMAEARAAHPNDPVAADRAANAIASNEIRRGDLPPKQAAGYAFFAYYQKNLIGVPHVCAQYGVQVDSFSNAFRRVSAPLLGIARQTIDVNLAKSLSASLSIPNARRELEHVATARNSDVHGVCTVMQEHGEEVAQRMEFSKIVPDQYAILVAPDRSPF